MSCETQFVCGDIYTQAASPASRELWRKPQPVCLPQGESAVQSAWSSVTHQILRWFLLTDTANLSKPVENIASFVCITKARLKSATQITGMSSATFLLSWHKKIVTYGQQQFRTLSVPHPNQKGYPEHSYISQKTSCLLTLRKKESKFKIQSFQEAQDSAIQNPSWANLALSQPIVVNKKASSNLSG